MQKRKRTTPKPETSRLAAAPLPNTDPKATQPEPDLLRAKIYEFSPEHQEAARTKLLAMAFNSITKMSIAHLQRVAQFVDICENNTGCTTPAEEFINDLVMRHYIYSLTPDDVAEDLESFRKNFNDAVETTQYFTAQYPELISPAATSAAGSVD
jgi:hypothetical protein